MHLIKLNMTDFCDEEGSNVCNNNVMKVSIAVTLGKCLFGKGS